VNLGDVAYVDERAEPGLGILGALLADEELVKVVDARVELVGRRDLVDDGSKDQRGLDRRDVERRLLRLDPLPRGALGVRLGSAVRLTAVDVLALLLNL
jgi:hypothetical protein